MADSYARYRHICGTAAEWAVSDIVIAEGEIAVELPSAPGAKPRVKAGDGTRRFSQLPYIDGMDQAALAATLNNYLLKTDGVGTAALSTAINAETARAEGAYVKLSGSAMTGQLTLLGTGTGKQAASVDQIKAALDATGTTTGGVGKNDQLVRTDANGVIDTSLINIPGVMKIKGAQDPTAAPPTVPAPTAGDAYIASVTGVANAAFGPGVTGTVSSGDMLIYIGGAQKWDVVAAHADLAAYVKKTGDTLSGNLTVNANLSVTGTTTSANLSVTGNTTLGDAVGDTTTINGATTFANVNPTLTAGRANSVAYLNGTKVLTTGSALTFDGTNLVLGANKFIVKNTVGDAQGLQIYQAASDVSSIFNYYDGALAFGINNSEQMRLTSTGLGIGTSSIPAGRRLAVAGGSVRIDNDQQIEWGGSTAGLYGNGSTNSLTFFTATTTRMTLDSSGNLIQSAPSTAPSLTANGQMVFNLTSNTNLRVSVRGSDGVTRTANITLA